VDAPRSPGERGFTLIETLVGTFLLVIGLIGLVQLLVVSTMVHHGAREASTPTDEAQTKLDELVKLDFTSASIQVNGTDTLERDVANYFDAPSPTLTRRWRVQDGPTANTRLLTVRVLNQRARQYGRQIDLTTVIRQW
jgi:hypothetical protein